MSVDVELTTDEQEALAGFSAPRWCCVFDTAAGPNVVATARVNGTPSYPLKTLAVDGVSADWADVAPGMAILIGSSAGSFNRGIYRVTDTGTSVTLELMAIGLNDSGSVAMVTRSAGITDNDYVTILRRLDLFGVYARIDYHEGLEADIYEDWNKAYTNQNEFPPPQVNVFIAGRAEDYGSFVGDEDEDTFDIDLAITLWPTSSDADWEIVLPDDFTLNSGSLTGSGLSASINVTAPHSADSFTVQFIVTEDHGSVFTAQRKVWIKSNTYPPLPVTIQTQDDEQGGSRRTVTVSSLTGFVPGARVHLFYTGNWNGVDVPSAIHAFSGYVVSARESTTPGLAGITLDLIGPSLMLDFIGGQSQIWSATASPASWQQIVHEMSYLDGVIWLYLYQRAAGLLQQFNCTLFGLPNDEKRMPAWRIDGGSLLSQVQALVKRYGGANFGADPGGELMFRVRPSRVWDRSGLDTRCELDASIYKTADLGAESRPNLRRLRGEALYGNTSSVTPVWSDAPEIPGQGTSEEKIDRLIVESPTELYRVTGLEYAARNNKYKSGSILIEKYYGVIRPAQLLRVWLEIPAELRYDGQAWEGYILPTKVSYTHNPDGTMNTVIAFEAETSGTIGVDAPIPVPDPTKYNSRYQARPFAPIPLARAIAKRNGNVNPAGTKEGAKSLPKDGSLGFCGTATNAYVVTNFTGTPAYRDVTPSGLGDFEIKHGALKVGGTRAWLLVSDGTDSKVYTTANVFATPRPTWSEGASVTGVYKLVRPSDTAGMIELYCPQLNSSTPTLVDTFTVDSALNSIQSGSFSTDTGHAYTMEITGVIAFATTAHPGQWKADGYVYTHDNFSSVFSTGSFRLEDGVTGYVPDTPVYQSSHVYTMTRTGTGAPFGGKFNDDPASYTDNAGSFTVNVYDIGVLSGAIVRHSTNDGDTWGSAIVVGTTPGTAGGFDVQHNGTVSYAAVSGKVRKATTLGGSYSDNQSFGADPLLIEIPWSTRNASSVNNSGSSPQYIVGLDAPDSGSTLFWIVSGSPVDITPSIGGDPGIAVGPDCLTTYLGKYVAFLAFFGGTKHLVTSKNGGGSWTDRGTVDAVYARVQRRAAAPGKLYLAGSALKFSSTFGVALASKTKPSSADLLFFEAYY